MMVVKLRFKRLNLESKLQPHMIPKTNITHIIEGP